MATTIAIRRGQQVRVKSAAAIAASLDSNGNLAGLPFMPEMLPMCGQVMTVQARADKTCDTVNLTGCSREMDNTVHLVGARCDGSAHGGCQAGCLLFFNEAWLEPVDTSIAGAANTTAEADATAQAALAEQLLRNVEVSPGTYRCQATQLLDATRPMVGLKHYVRDLQTKNVTPSMWVRGIRIAVFDRYQRLSRRLPPVLRIQNGDELPVVRGTLTKTPVEYLNLEPGELVEVKSLAEIRATLNANQKNRNLWYDREMVKYCGARMRVVRRVDRLLDEKTGQMLEMGTPSVMLEGGLCMGDYHKLCPRLAMIMFREIWLRRIPEDIAPDRPVAVQQPGGTTMGQQGSQS